MTMTTMGARDPIAIIQVITNPNPDRLLSDVQMYAGDQSTRAKVVA
jgi:hypothetical protein